MDFNLFEQFKNFMRDLFRSKDPYNISVEIVNVAKFVTIQPGCNGFMFTNVGDTTAEVNGMVIYPGVVGTSVGTSRSIGSFKNDIYKGNIKVKFTGVIGTGPAVEIVQVCYT